MNTCLNKRVLIRAHYYKYGTLYFFIKAVESDVFHFCIITIDSAIKSAYLVSALSLEQRTHAQIKTPPSNRVLTRKVRPACI